MHQLLVNVVYTPRVGKKGEGVQMTFKDIFKDKKGLENAFSSAKDENTSPNVGLHLADGVKFEQMEALLKRLYVYFLHLLFHLFFSFKSYSSTTTSFDLFCPIKRYLLLLCLRLHWFVLFSILFVRQCAPQLISWV
jgi:hypothetical protein